MHWHYVTQTVKAFDVLYAINGNCIKKNPALSGQNWILSFIMSQYFLFGNSLNLSPSICLEVWRFVIPGTTSPCVRSATTPAATGSLWRHVAQLEPATCSTTRPRSFSPFSWPSGVRTQSHPRSNTVSLNHLQIRYCHQYQVKYLPNTRCAAKWSFISGNKLYFNLCRALTPNLQHNSMRLTLIEPSSDVLPVFAAICWQQQGFRLQKCCVQMKLVSDGATAQQPSGVTRCWPEEARYHKNNLVLKCFKWRKWHHSNKKMVVAKNMEEKNSRSCHWDFSDVPIYIFRPNSEAGS